MNVGLEDTRTRVRRLLDLWPRKTTTDCRGPRIPQSLLERFENEWREMRTVGEAAQKTVPPAE